MSTHTNHQVKRLSQELQALTEIAKTLTSSMDLPELLNAISSKIVGTIEPADVGAVMLWDQSAGLFRAWAAVGYDLEILKGIGLRAGEAITGKVYDEGKARLLSTPEEVAIAMEDIQPANLAVIARSLNSEKSPFCTLAAPISVEDQKYGVLVLESLNRPFAFSDDDIPFVQLLADLIALAIDRAKLEAMSDDLHESHETEQMRSELLATLSHELRLPLTSIKGYATALLLDEVTWTEEKQAEFLHLIEEECDNMHVMLTDILDSSIIEVEQLNFEPELLRLELIAHDVSVEMQHRTKQHRLIVDFPPSFPLIEADPHWIKQVFRNIIDNAIKYSPNGGLIVIKGELRPKDVVVNIADQGIGISPENLIPLFEKYFRVKSPSNFSVPGMGLGLPIARTIIEAHEGRIWAESKEGQGTTLSFSLPRPKIKSMEND